MPSAALQVTCSACTVFLFVGPTLGVYFAVGEGRILSLNFVIAVVATAVRPSECVVRT